MTSLTSTARQCEHEQMRAAPDVHVFWATPRPPDELQALLDDDDHDHLGWLRSARARAESATARALLRAVARDRLGTDVVITRGCPACGRPHGRPEVAALHVSASHTDGLVLVALSDVGPVGVDVERLDAHHFDGIAIDAAEWTRREAAFKANSGAKSPRGGAKTPRSVEAFDPSRQTSDYGQVIDVGAGYAAALCVPAKPVPRVEITAADGLLAAWAAPRRTATA